MRIKAKNYKHLSKQRNVFGRGTIQATAQFLEVAGSPHAHHVLALLEQSPLEKPSKHLGGPETDYFVVDLSPDVVRGIVEDLLVAEAAAVSPDGDTSPEASFIGNLVNAWGSYLRSLIAL